MVLILGGTSEAREIVEAILGQRRQRHLIVSLAGRTRDPSVSAETETRVGGFGGVEGLTRFLGERGITHLIDATHPFAARMAANAASAAMKSAVPAVKLLRPEWTQHTDDRWHHAADERAAAIGLPPAARPFLALGRQYLADFAIRPDLSPVLRMIETPRNPLPFPAEVVLGRPNSSAAEEIALFQSLGVTHIVCRNSGGEAGYGKVAAARALGLPVFMISRPSPPTGIRLLPSVDAVLHWLEAADGAFA